MPTTPSSTAGVARAVHAAVFAQLALAVYLQVIEWIPLAPWNDLSHGNGQEGLDLIIAVVALALIAGTLRRSLIALVAGICVNAAWLWLQLVSWWPPYFRGASPGQHRFYDRWFGRTYTFLPAIGDHPVPDAAHVVLQVLVLVALATTIWATIRVWAQRVAPVPSPAPDPPAARAATLDRAR